MERKPLAKVKPISDLTAICMTPGSLFSTGSSIVTMRVSEVFTSLRKEYKLVDFPEPVGPVIKTIPLDSLRSCVIFSSTNGSSASLAMVNFSWLSKRKLTLSPSTVGTVATRTSMVCPSNWRLILPSCGKRRSAMSKCAIIFRRAMTELCSALMLSGTVTSTNNPSMRYRMRKLS